MDFISWKNFTLDQVRYIADKAYQERVWFGFGHHEVEDPIETCARLENVIFRDFLQLVDLTEKQRVLGCVLQEKMDNYDGNFYDAKFVFNDPKWEEIRQAAKAFLESFENEASA